MFKTNEEAFAVGCKHHIDDLLESDQIDIDTWNWFNNMVVRKYLSFAEGYPELDVPDGLSIGMEDMQFVLDTMAAGQRMVTKNKEQETVNV